MTTPLPPGEDARLAALQEYDLLDTASEESYGDITRLAAFICGTPIAAITLVDAERQWFNIASGWMYGRRRATWPFALTLFSSPT